MEIDEGQVVMWKLFQRKQALRGMVELSAESLSGLPEPLAGKLVILDLRGRDEVEQYPYIIPGGLLTTKIDPPTLIGWAPPQSWVVLYAMDRIPQSCSRLHLLRNDLSFYVLTGGLRAWWATGLEMDSVDHYAGSLRTRR